jgi:hypothetical protein
MGFKIKKGRLHLSFRTPPKDAITKAIKHGMHEAKESSKKERSEHR